MYRMAGVIVVGLVAWFSLGAGPEFRHLSSKTGDLPVPGESTQQTGAIVGDFDGDGLNDFILSFRAKAPALVEYRRTASAWERIVIEPELIHLEAGGAIGDIAGNGRPDIVFGEDYHGNRLFWWENPGKGADPKIPWKRHLIKADGAKQHHDQVFGDFKGTGRPQLVFWNQQAKKLFLADIPADAKTRSEPWPYVEIFAAQTPVKGPPYNEGLAAADIDGDGKLDILAGDCWLKHVEGNTFKATKIADYGGRIAAAKLIKDSKIPQIVISSGDGVGPLVWYACEGRPDDPAAWKAHELLPKVVHGHSLAIADIDGDGNLDIFTAEMAKWHENQAKPDNPEAKAWIFYGDGKGGFRQEILATGIGFHEARVADLNGDGKLDILDKPYNWEAPRVDVWLQK